MKILHEDSLPIVLSTRGALGETTLTVSAL